MLYLPVYMYIVCVPGAHRSQKRASDSPAVELQAVLRASWLPGSKPRSSARASVFLTTKPTLQSCLQTFLNK